MASKELQSIICARETALARGEPAALITVFETTGSTYRRAGARMLVLPAMTEKLPGLNLADALGSISGGCLEDDARERAQRAIATGQSESVEYDTTPESDILLGSGLGCQGIVRALIQSLPKVASAEGDPLLCLSRGMRERRSGMLATVCEGNDALLGKFLWQEEGGAECGTLREVDPALAATVAADARESMGQGRPAVRTYPHEGKLMRVFFEFMRPPRSILICGAGQDAVPLARFGKTLGWRVRVVDGRRAYATRARFPDVDTLSACPPAEFAARGHRVEAGEAVVVMTHNFAHDRAFLEMALASPAGYIGMLGPRHRTERLIAEVTGPHNPHVGKRALARIHGPAGLDIGAETPEEIALAIVAEIEAVGAGRKGGVLKRRRAPLHEPADLKARRAP